jgi:uncharacterized membrane protein/protein-disulfide isomerase
MQESLTLRGPSWPRTLSFFSGLGMIWASLLSIRHFFAANYPTSIYEGSVCDINAFLNCDSSAYSVIAEIGGVPLGYFGMFMGGLVALGAVFPTTSFERTNKTLALINVVGVIGLFFFSILFLRSLCLVCTLYYAFAIASFALFAAYGIDKGEPGFLRGYLRPSMKHLTTYGVVMLAGAYGYASFHDAKKEAQSGGVAARVVQEYYALEQVELPSFISPFLTVRSTERFEDAPIRIIEYGDLLCPDCLYLREQLSKLKEEFEGKINIAFQFFPLEGKCNSVVEKDLHPGVCDLTYMAAHDPEKFLAIHDEIFDNFQAAKYDPEWRAELGRRFGVEAALTDSATIDLVHRIMNTGREYEKTDEQYAHGIRSTPTMILNNRMLIGTLPYQQLRAIFRALVDEHEGETTQPFMENWVETP